MYDDELIVVGTMACEPQSAIEYAWASLHADDFEDETHRWVFEQLVAVWHLAEGDVSHGPHFWEILAIGFSRHFKEGEDWGFGAIEQLQSASFGEPVFRWHVDRLVNASAVRRLRTRLYEWSQFLCALEMCNAQGEPMPIALKLAFDNDDAGHAAIERTMTMFADAGYHWRSRDVEYPDVRRAIAAMLRDMRRELRRSPEAPRCADLEKVTAKAEEVGVW